MLKIAGLAALGLVALAAPARADLGLVAAPLTPPAALSEQWRGGPIRPGRRDVAVWGSALGAIEKPVQLLWGHADRTQLSGSAEFVPTGFNLLPSFVAQLMLSQRIGKLLASLDLAYGQSTLDDDRFAALRVSNLWQLQRQLQLGLDVRAAADLELDAQEPSREPQLKICVGPVVRYAFQHLVLGLQAGAGPVQYRFADNFSLGTSVGIVAAHRL